MQKDKTYTLSVWNLYKSKKPNLSHSVSKIMISSDFVLMQEYVSSLNKHVPANYFLSTNYTFKIPAKKVSTGTAVVSKYEPVLIKKQFSKYKEAWVGTRKSVIASTYDLDGSKITLLNLHALNFVGLKSYKKVYLDWLALLPSSGAVIVAGDFNTWSSRRRKFIDSEMLKREFTYYPYDHDKFLTLDHIWVRGIEAKHVECDITNKASDHYPLKLSFSFTSDVLEQ